MFTLSEVLYQVKKYILHEELAPLGYATASDVTFTVNEDGSVTKVKMKDEITKVDISKSRCNNWKRNRRG